MAEDPTVYQYDEVYDQMEEKKLEENAAKNADKATKKPRYIQKMIKNAERQKRENERRIERQVQKDREAEGEQFADKEKFVTSAYRKKMEENAKIDEEEERMDRIEKALDVKGQKDMSGFYRHLYRQTMGEEKGQKSAAADEVLHDAPKDKAEIKKFSSKKREYRKRDDTRESDSEKDQSTSSSESDDTENSNDKQKTVEAQETEEINEKEIEQQKYHKEEARRNQLRIEKEKRDKRKRRIEMGQDTSSDESDKEDLDVTQDKNITAKPDQRPETDKANSGSVESDKKRLKKQKVDIWKKVTIGDVFEAALQRYLIRKQSRTTWP